MASIWVHVHQSFMVAAFANKTISEAALVYAPNKNTQNIEVRFFDNLQVHTQEAATRERFTAMSKLTILEKRALGLPLSADSDYGKEYFSRVDLSDFTLYGGKDVR